MPQGGHNKGNGKGYRWLLAHLHDPGGECLIWPFSRQPTGYGALGHEGKLHYAHRLMCHMVNGPPPTDDHQAAHSCNNGKLGCVHPRHLTWKTPSENKLDQSLHGTNKGSPYGNKGAFTPEQVRAIRASNEKFPFAGLAKQYSVSSDTIRWIKKGRYYKSVA